MSDDRRLVYSTDGSLPLPKKERPRAPAPKAATMPDDGVVRVARERRRAGIMTLVTGIPADQIDETGKVLRRLCGTGGTSKNGIVELQGDHRERIVTYFTEKGLRVKKAGG